MVEPDVEYASSILSNLGNTSNIEVSVLTERFANFRDHIERFDRDLEQGLLESFEDFEEKVGKTIVTSNEFANIPRYFTSERVLVNELCFCLKPFVKKNIHTCLPHCKHRYHVECIYKWLTTHSRYCPICRRDAVTGESKD